MTFQPITHQLTYQGTCQFTAYLKRYGLEYRNAIGNPAAAWWQNPQYLECKRLESWTKVGHPAPSFYIKWIGGSTKEESNYQIGMANLPNLEDPHFLLKRLLREFEVIWNLEDIALDDYITCLCWTPMQIQNMMMRYWAIIGWLTGGSSSA